MTDGKDAIIDFIAKGDSEDEWRVVLVEEGPWPGPIEEQLRRIQGRLYDCIDIVLDGQLAEKFPDSRGKRIILQLDCYNLPRGEVGEFFRRFADGVFLADGYREALQKGEYATEITLTIQFDNIH